MCIPRILKTNITIVELNSGTDRNANGTAGSQVDILFKNMNNVNQFHNLFIACQLIIVFGDSA
jgi:hypothetical protein